MGGVPGVDPAGESRHGVPHVPSEGPLRTRVFNHGRGTKLGKQTVAAIAVDAVPKKGMAIEGAQTVGNGLYLQG